LKLRRAAAALPHGLWIPMRCPARIIWKELAGNKESLPKEIRLWSCISGICAGEWPIPLGKRRERPATGVYEHDCTGLSLVAIVVAGLTFAFGEGGSKSVLADVPFGARMAIAAVNFLSWLFPGTWNTGVLQGEAYGGNHESTECIGHYR
jgi:hypothetical protein